MKYKKKKGFTLIELVVVIAIIGILAAIAIPKYNTSRRAAAETAHKSNVQMLHTAALVKQNELTADEKTKGVTWTKGSGDWKDYIEKWPVVPSNLKFDKEYKDYTVTITPTEIKIDPDESKISGTKAET